MDIPKRLIDRMLVLNPTLDCTDVHAAIEALYKPAATEWMPDKHARHRVSGIELRERFNIPRTPVTFWRNLAVTGADVCPVISAWLDDIGVPA